MNSLNLNFSTVLIDAKFKFQHTHSYIKLFLQHGMVGFESILQRKTEDVIEFLRHLQRSTRFLHSLCCHSKVFKFVCLEGFLFLLFSFIHSFAISNFFFPLKTIKDTAIIALIPPLRETLSQLMYKVQAALVVNNCSSIFSAGNLKNKDIHGDEILSQVMFLK